MKRDTAATLFAELGCSTRLRIIRHLIIAKEEGLSVGEIQRTLDIPASTLSHHLSRLVRVGLMRQERSGRVLQCHVISQTVTDLVEYLQYEYCHEALGPVLRDRIQGS